MYIVFIYISNPTFPLFKNRFSDNLRLFKRQIVPIRIRNRFDFSTALSVCQYTVEGPSHGRGAYGHNVWHNARRILSLGSSLVYFSPPHHPLSSLLRSLISVIEHRTRTRSQCSARSVHIRNGTRVVSLYTRFYTLPSFVLCSPLSSRLSRCMQILSTNLLSARASVLGGR